MAWTTIGTTNLINPSNTLVGYVYLQYDNASSGSTWAVRLITGARSGYSFNVRFDNVTVDGNNQGQKTGVTQNNVVVWSGNLSSNGRTINGSWSCPWTGGTKSYTISGYLPAKGTAPSGPFATYDSSTWNSITFTAGVTSTGGMNIRNHGAVFTGSSNGAIDSVHAWSSVGRYEYFHDSTQDLSYQFVATTANASVASFTPIEIKGLLHYKLGVYADNSMGEVYTMVDTLYYLPPSRPIITYTDPGTIGAKTFPVVVTGDLQNNHTTYDSADLTRTVRYSIDGGAWTYVIDNVVTALNASTTFNVTVPAGSSATVESWMSYHGMGSDVESTVLSNTNAPIRFYGSVDGRAKLLDPVYGTFGNYFDPLHYIDRSSYVAPTRTANDITLAKTSSGSSGDIWLAFPIDTTDELIGKQVTLSIDFATSGSFTSGARLWWLNSANTDLLSGPVDSIEIIENSGSYSVSGTVPAKPSGAGKLAVLLYSNIASAAQGVSTTFSKVELKANLVNLIPDYPTHTGGAITTTVTNSNFAISGQASGSWPSLSPSISIAPLPPGTIITLSTSTTFDSTAKLYSRFYYNSGLSQYIGMTLGNDASAAAICFKDQDYTCYGVQLYLNTTSGTQVDKTSNIQIAAGMNELTGDELIDTSVIGSGSQHGLEYTTSEDGWVTITGTATANGHISMNYTIPSNMIGKTVTMYYEGRVHGISNTSIKNGTSDVGSILTLTNTVIARTFKVTSANQAAVSKYDIYYTNGSAVDSCFRFHLREGSCAKDFAPHVDTKTHKLRKVYGSVNGITKLIYTE